MILAFFSIFGGWFAAPRLMAGVDYFEQFVQPVFSAYGPPAAELAPAPAEAAATPAMELVHALTGLPVIVAVLGLLVAWWFYVKSPDTPKRWAERARGLHTLVLNKYFVDEIYAALFVRPLLWISTRVFWRVVDEGVIDGAIHGTARVARESGGQLRKLQSGNARSYAAWVIMGAVGFTVLLLALLGVAR
jgi:NADH-quinone oxidoreductase subunit L